MTSSGDDSRARPFTPEGKFGLMDVCVNGHPRTLDNLYVDPSGKRKCRECRRIANQINGRTPTQNSWRNMLTRCLDPRHPKFKYYGGRGVTVCERWRTFDNFLADMGERPDGRTIDRIDPDGNYEPTNCRWATAAEQRRNQRPRNPRTEASG